MNVGELIEILKGFGQAAEVYVSKGFADEEPLVDVQQETPLSKQTPTDEARVVLTGDSFWGPVVSEDAILDRVRAERNQFAARIVGLQNALKTTAKIGDGFAARSRELEAERDQLQTKVAALREAGARMLAEASEIHGDDEDPSPAVRRLFSAASVSGDDTCPDSIFNLHEAAAIAHDRKIRAQALGEAADICWPPGSENILGRRPLDSLDPEKIAARIRALAEKERTA